MYYWTEYYLQAMHEETLEHLLLLPLDNDDNTIAHLAALEGISSVFKVAYNANVYVYAFYIHFDLIL